MVNREREADEMVKRRETKTGLPIVVIDSGENVSSAHVERIRKGESKPYVQRLQEMSHRQVEQLEKRIQHSRATAQEITIYVDYCKVTGWQPIEEVEL